MSFFDKINPFKNDDLNPFKNPLRFEGGVPNFIGDQKQKMSDKAKEKEKKAKEAAKAEKVNQQAQERFIAQQNRAIADAQEKLLTIRMRKANRSGTLLTDPSAMGMAPPSGQGSATLG